MSRSHRPIISLLSSLLLSLLFIVACDDGAPGQTAEEGGDTTEVREQAFGPIDTTLYDSLRAIERRTGGLLGVAAIHLESGWMTSYRGKETFPMASVAKLPMAIRFLQLVDGGAFRLDSSVVLHNSDRRPGASLVYHRAMRAGGSATLHDLLDAMIGASDNTASDYLLRLAGGPRSVDSLMSALGLDGVDVTHDEGELILLWAGVDPSAIDSGWTRDRYYTMIEEAGDTAWRMAEERLVDDPADAATPEEMARLLAMVQRGEILDAMTTDTLLAIMRRATTGKARIPALLPPGTPVAHKTGTISSTTNDVGIVTLPEGRGHLVIVAFVKGSRVGVRARERAIASAASLLYRHAIAQRL